jgi:hypothetical protein
MSARPRAKDVDFTGCRGEDACNGLEEGALARAVGPHDGNTLCLVKMEGNILQCHPPVITDIQMAHVEDRLAG